MEECTDVTTVEELSISCRWVEDGVPVEHLLEIVSLKSADAKTIYSALVKFLEEKNIRISKLHQASCFSLMTDECTDVTTVEEQLLQSLFTIRNQLNRVARVLHVDIVHDSAYQKLSLVKIENTFHYKWITFHSNNVHSSIVLGGDRQCSVMSPTCISALSSLRMSSARSAMLETTWLRM